MSALLIRNRQRVRRVNTPLLRRIVRSVLTDLVGVGNYELGIHLVATPEITQLNETFLQHAGSTDVITFDYPDDLPASPFHIRWERTGVRILRGEIFVCIDEAVSQARAFRATWQSELVRYIVHGVLHLIGHDDLRSPARRKMKREEDRLLRLLSSSFTFANLQRSARQK